MRVEQNPNTGQDTVVKGSKGFIYGGVWGTTQGQPSRKPETGAALQYRRAPGNRTASVPWCSAVLDPWSSKQHEDLKCARETQKTKAVLLDCRKLNKRETYHTLATENKRATKEDLTMPTHNEGSQTNTLALIVRHNLLK